MSEASDDELERIREQKRKELRQKLQEGSDTASTSTAEETFDAPVEIEGEAHLDKLLDSELPVLVDCYADWCGPCQMMEPTIEALAAETPAVVAKVDVDAHPPLAGKLGAQGVPTLLLFVDGEPVERLVGAKDKATLEGLIRQHL